MVDGEILITSSKEFEGVKKRIYEAGADKFHVVSDLVEEVLG